MFETSYDDYSAGRHDMAIQGFQGFVQAFPRHPMAAAALYNVGMSYLSLSKWPESRDAFLKVINEYPQAQGSVVPDAYFKLGSTYEKPISSTSRKRTGGHAEIPGRRRRCRVRRCSG
jgi:TolA-binding protein